MSRLERFIGECQAVAEVKDSSHSISSFNNLVDFLRNPETFPNPEINKSLALIHRMVLNGEVSVSVNKDDCPDIMFLVVKKLDNSEEFIKLLLPQDFSNQVKEDPVLQLAMVVCMSSFARDFYTKRIKTDHFEKVESRARAFEAESLLTLMDMAKNEGISLNFNVGQRNILETFPKGLKNLLIDSYYPTLDYLPPDFRPDLFMRNN